MADWYPTTAAEIITAIESLAEPGDTVHIPAGSFDLPETLTIPAGIAVVGAGKTLSILIGSNSGFNSNAAGSADEVIISDLTMDITGVAPGILFKNGIYTLTDVHVQGPATSEANSLSIQATDNATTAVLTRVSSDDSSRDCISFSGSAGGSGTLYDCSAEFAGDAATHNCLTTHEGFPIVDNNGYYDGSNNQAFTVIAADTASHITLNGTTVIGRVTGWRLIDCNVTLTGIANSVVNIWGTDCQAVRCRIIGDGDSTAGIILTSAVNPTIESCWISGVTNGSAVLGSSATSGLITIVNNRSDGNQHAYNTGNGTNQTGIILKNNTEASSEEGTKYAFNTFTVIPPITGGYNTFENIVDADYGGAKTGDEFATTPQYTSGSPTPGGNLDGAGDPTVSLISNLDLNGKSRLTDGTICKGPVEIPDTVAPTVSSASINEAGDTLTVEFYETESPPTLPANGASGFSLTGTSVNVDVITGTITGLTGSFPLTGFVYHGQTITLSYSAGGNITDSAVIQNSLAAFNRFAISNNSILDLLYPVNVPRIGRVPVLTANLVVSVTYNTGSESFSLSSVDGFITPESASEAERIVGQEYRDFGGLAEMFAFLPGGISFVSTVQLDDRVVTGLTAQFSGAIGQTDDSTIGFGIQYDGFSQESFNSHSDTVEAWNTILADDGLRTAVTELLSLAGLDLG